LAAQSATANGALLLHDGELEDVRLLLVGAGADCTELRSSSAPPDRGTRFRVAIGTGQRLASSTLPALATAESRIAILDRDSKTLRAMLKRVAVDYLVFRPVHPTALRLLVTRLLYQGPERRRSKRYTVGAPITFRSGLWRRQALLADLSLQGCNLVSSRSAKFGAKVKLWLGTEVTGAKPLCLSGQVTRVGPTEDAQAGNESLGIRFDALGKRELAELQALVERFRSGPAAWTGEALSRQKLSASRAPAEVQLEQAGEAALAPASPAEAAEAGGRELPPAFDPGPAVPEVRAASDPAPSGAGATSEQALDGAPEADASVETALCSELDSRERRQDSRHAYSRRVVSQADMKPCVLIGRDLSTGGIRVEATDRLELGMSVQLAIHIKAGEAPLVLSARVERDDGDEGFALQFSGLSGNQEAYLRTMLASMPTLSSIVGDDEPIVLCEVNAV